MENDVFQRLRRLIDNNPELNRLLELEKEEMTLDKYSEEDRLNDLTALLNEYKKKLKSNKISADPNLDDSKRKKSTTNDLLDFYDWVFTRSEFALIQSIAMLRAKQLDTIKDIKDGKKQVEKLIEEESQARRLKDQLVDNHYKEKLNAARITLSSLDAKNRGLTFRIAELEQVESDLKNSLTELENEKTSEEKKLFNIEEEIKNKKEEFDKLIADYVTEEKAKKDKEISQYLIDEKLRVDNEVEQEKREALALVKQEVEQERERLQSEILQPLLEQIKETSTQIKLAEQTLNDMRETITEKEADLQRFEIDIKNLNLDIEQAETKKNNVLTQLTTSEQFFSLMGAMVTLPDTLNKFSEEVTHASEETKNDVAEIRTAVTKLSTDSEENTFSIKATVMESALHVVDQTSDAINEVSTSLESYRSGLVDELKAIFEGMPKLNEIVQPELDKMNALISSLEGYTGDLRDVLVYIRETTDNLVKNANKYDIDQHVLREYRRQRVIDNEEKSNLRNMLTLITRELTLYRGIVASTVSEAFKLDDAIKHYPLTREGFINYFIQLGMISANDLEEMFYKANGQASPLMHAIRLRTRFNNDYTKMIAEYFAPHFNVTVIMPDADNYKLLEKYDIKTIFSELRSELSPGEKIVSTTPILGNISRVTFDYELVGRLDPDRFEELRDDIFSTDPLLVEAMMDDVMTNDNILISEKASVLAKGATDIPFYTASLMGVILDKSIDESRNPMAFPDPDIINEGVHLMSLVDSSSLPEDFYSLLRKYPFIDAKYMFDTASLKDYYDDLEVGIYTITLPAYFKEIQSVERISFGFYHDGIVPFMTGVYNAMKELAEEQSERVADEDNSYKPFSENGIPLPASLEYFKGGQLSDTD